MMERILVVDDDVLVRHMLVRMLEKEGYKVDKAANGKEAIELYSAKPADLVITDIVMPEKEGIETIQQLRHKSPGVRIIAISGGGRLGSNDYLERAKKAGAVRTFAKPFARKALLEAVREVLSGADDCPEQETIKSQG